MRVPRGSLCLLATMLVLACAALPPAIAAGGAPAARRPPAKTTSPAVAEPETRVMAEVVAPIEVVAPPPPSAELADGVGVVVEEAQHQSVPFESLPTLVGRRVTVATAGGKVHKGVLRAATPREITLEVRRAGGMGVYTLTRAQVLRVELR